MFSSSSLCRAVYNGALLVVLSALQPASAQVDWNDRFSASGFEILGLDAFNFFTDAGSGFVLLAESNGGSGQGLVRFDSAGDELWNIAFSPAGADEDSVEISPDITGTNHFYATYFRASDSTVQVGRFDAGTGGPVFSFSIPGLTDPEQVATSQLIDGGGAVLQVTDSAVHVIVFNQAGGVVFDRRYTGSFLTGLDDTVDVNAEFYEKPDGGYVLKVDKTENIVVDPTTQEAIYPVGLLVANLSANGQVTAAKSFASNSANAVPVLFSVLPNGEIVLSILEVLFDPVLNTVTNASRTLKLGTDLEIDWAFRLSSGAFTNWRTDPTNTDIYLSGHVTAGSGGEIDTLVVQLDLSSGALKNSFVADFGEDETSFIAEVLANDVYIQSVGVEGVGDARTSVSRLSRSLTLAKAIAYTGDHLTAFTSYDSGSDTLALSVLDQANGAKALALSRSLDYSVTCDTLMAVNPVLGSAPALGAYAPSLTTETLSSNTTATSLGAASFAFTPFNYLSEPDFCSEETGSNGGGQAGISLIGTQWTFSFPTEEGAFYLVSQASDLSNFVPVTTLFGDGSVMTYPFDPSTGPLFFFVSEISF